MVEMAPAFVAMLAASEPARDVAVEILGDCACQIKALGAGAVPEQQESHLGIG